MTRTAKLLVVPVVLLQLCFFLFVARHRLIDGDEGFYLLASRLVLEHKVPYLDFFYTQAPLLPYVYALWIKFIEVSWISARVFPGLLTTLMGVLVYLYVCRETQKWIGGVAAVILFASSTLVFAWFPIVKTFSVATLFLFCAYVIVSRFSVTSPRWLIAVAGLLFGLSVDTRSYVVALAPVFLWWIFRNSETRNRLGHMAWFLGGFIIGIAPSLYLFFASPDLFMFNNLGYHAMRSDGGLIGGVRSKLHVVRSVLFGPEDGGFQFAILVIIGFVGIFLLRLRRGASLFAFSIALVLGFVSILPSPPLVQYYSMCMPFLIVAVVCVVNDYIASQSKHAKRTLALACLVLLVGFIVPSVFSLRRYLVTGWGVIGIKNTSDAPNWTLDRVSAVSRAIDQVALPKEEIASFWPGYIFESHADPYPGFENNFGFIVAPKVTADQRARYRIIYRPEMEADFGAHVPRIAVVGNQGIWGGAPRVPACEALLRLNGYAVSQTIGATSIFVCCSRQ